MRVQPLSRSELTLIISLNISICEAEVPSSPGEYFPREQQHGRVSRSFGHLLLLPEEVNSELQRKHILNPTHCREKKVKAV